MSTKNTGTLSISMLNRQQCIQYLCSLILLTTIQFAYAHGTVTSPPSRIWNCYQENPENPVSAPCIAAVASHGTQALYDWNEINQLFANGDHMDVAPDGYLASGGRPDKYGGMDLLSLNWVATPVSSGPFTVTWTNSAPHATSYYDVYITNEGWSPDQPLTWGNLTLLTRTEPSTASGTVDIPVTLPVRTGKHVIYSIWQRSDSPEAFYSTSDVDFGSALPTELIAFNANVSEQAAVELTWATATEGNNAYFTIERSTDGIHFTAIGKVLGAGTTAKTQSYHFVDNTATNGKNYYRLQQVDFDGGYVQSSIAVVEVKSVSSLLVYPTIASDFIQITLKERSEADVSFQVFDIEGRLVQSTRIAADNAPFNLSITDFVRGIYFIRFRWNGRVVTKQFVKI